MNKENTKKLFESFPLLYADKDESMRVSLLCFGFEYGDGWFDLTWELSEKLENLIKEWLPKNLEHIDYHPRAAQMKEKFGVLTFYMTSYTDEMTEVIHEYMKKSKYVCENCGKEGKIRAGGYILTLCDECATLRSKGGLQRW